MLRPSAIPAFAGMTMNWGGSAKMPDRCASGNDGRMSNDLNTKPLHVLAVVMALRYA